MGDYIGDYYRVVMNGDTWSLDYGNYGSYKPMFHYNFL